MFHKLLAAESDELMYTTMELGAPQATTEATAGAAAGGAVLGLVYLAIIIIMVIALWKVFKKAGQPGWAAIVPIYNTYVLLKIAGRPWWWLLLLLVPFVGFVVSIIVGIDVAKRFGKGPVFGAVLCGLLGIGYLILGFDKSRYQGDAPTNSFAAPTSY